MKCSECGCEEKLQTHHISYTPEETQILCVKCHQKVHNKEHGVGRPKVEEVVEKRLSSIRVPVIEERKVIKMGGSRGITIPSKWLESKGIGEGDKILIVGNEILKIRPSSEEAIEELHKKLEVTE